MKNLMTFKGLLFLALSVIFLISLTGQANADVTYYFGDYNMFGTPPQWGGVAPTGTWATATFIDVTPGSKVQLTLGVSNNLTSVESIGAFYFNSLMNTSSLTIAPLAGGGSTATISKGSDSYQPDGDGLYDLLFKFPPPGDTFTKGETVTYDITGTGVYASNFQTLAAPGTGSNGPFYAAVKLQGIPCDQVNYPDCEAEGGTTSSFAAGTTTIVPEPISSTLFIVGGAVIGFRRFKKMKKA